MDTVYVLQECNKIDLVAISAVCIALCALGISIWQGFTQRSHNKKTVLPIPQLYTSDFINEIEIRVENVGAGSMIVENFKVLDQKNSFKSLVESVPQPPQDFPWYNFSSSTNFTVFPGKTKTMLHYKLPEIENKNCNNFLIKLREKLSELEISFTYCNVYNDKFHFAEKLIWYKRHNTKSP